MNSLADFADVSIKQARAEASERRWFTCLEWLEKVPTGFLVAASSGHLRTNAGEELLLFTSNTLVVLYVLPTPVVDETSIERKHSSASCVAQR